MYENWRRNLRRKEIIYQGQAPATCTGDRSIYNRHDISLAARSPYDLEYVTIVWNNADDQRVYVTGDSLLAISRDVLRTMR